MVMKKTGKQKKISKNLENTLKQLAELEMLINKGPAIIIIWRCAEGWPVEFISENITNLGYPKDDFLSGRISLLDITHPDDLARVQEGPTDDISEDTLDRFKEYRIICKKGDVLWVQDRTIAIFDNNGKISHLQGIIVDITDRKKMEAALRKSSAILQELFRNSRDIIAVFDKNGIFQYVSPSLTSITNYQEPDLIGKSVFKFIHHDDQEVAVHDFSELVTGENDGIATEFRFRKADGSWICLEALGNNCLDNPAINGLIINARDTTMRKRMEDHLFQAHKMQAIGTLAGGIAHDFNNLLMGIQGYISLMLLSKDSGDPDFGKLNSMQSLVQSGADLAANLLGFARGGQYELKPTDLNELVFKTANIFGRTKKEIMIHQKYGKNIWPVEVDRIQIEQVLINLYVNAWQAMPGDGGDIYLETNNITLGAHDALIMNIPEGKYAQIMITDTGMGMDEETCRRVFEPFFTTKERGRGVGLGLASAYGIVKEHGGTIDVASELGHGTIFSIYLPATSKEISRETIKSRTIIKGNETILLVDDEESIVEVCGEILSTLGYKVLRAASGKDGLQIFAENKGRIDLVILDMIMPGMSGGETFDALRQIGPEGRVMLSSGDIVSDQAKKIMEKGCQAFIQKPFRMEELSRKIREVLDRNE
jgi:two-component system, cell cycle sensor histidine kinase and response regulator CckA